MHCLALVGISSVSTSNTLQDFKSCQELIGLQYVSSKTISSTVLYVVCLWSTHVPTSDDLTTSAYGLHGVGHTGRQYAWPWSSSESSCRAQLNSVSAPCILSFKTDMLVNTHRHVTTSRAAAAATRCGCACGYSTRCACGVAFQCTRTVDSHGLTPRATDG